MALSTTVKNLLNRGLRSLDLELHTLAAPLKESARLDSLESSGYFDRPAFDSHWLKGVDLQPIVQANKAFASELNALYYPEKNVLGFDIENSYFSSPDAEILYLLVRSLEPSRVLEVGSGNSTRIVRQAIETGRINTSHTAIDPWPRVEVEKAVNQLLKCRVEDADAMEAFSSLGAGDILFIDSSHELKAGNDCTYLFLNVLPKLAKGVIVHVHDVFLPYDYPLEFLRGEPMVEWNEQYVLQALIQSGEYKVLWPGYQLQQSKHECLTELPFCGQGRAQSFWFEI